MLEQTESQRVIEALANHLANEGNVREMIRLTFSPNHKPLLLELPTDMNAPADQALLIVNQCLVSGWSLVPSLLELLLIRLVDRAGEGWLAPIRDRVHDKIDPNVALFSTCWVVANQPFFDRSEIRKAAKNLLANNQRPILRVNGPDKSGKSYTAEYLSYVLQKARPDVYVAVAKLPKGSGPSYEVTELAEQLTLPMPENGPTPARTTASYSTALCRWIIKTAGKKPGMWVLILDGFGQKLVRSEVTELVQKLAQQILEPEISKRMRLVLLDYDLPLGDLESTWKAKTVDDAAPDPSSIKSEHLVECLNAHNERMRREGRVNKVIAPGEIARLADDLLARAPADKTLRLKALYDELFRVGQMGDT